MKTNKQKIVIVEKTDIYELGSNGGKNQQIIFNYNNKTFKIAIRSESYDFQSYAKLSLLTIEKGFSLIINKNPETNYNINISYLDMKKVSNNFDCIIKDLTNIATKIN